MSDTNEELKAQLYQSAVTFSQLRKCDIKDVFVHDFNIEERKENGRVTAIIELDFYDYQKGGLLKDKATNAPKKKIETPENMAIEGTARIATVITEPNFMAGATAESMTIDGEPIEEAIKANSDSKRQPIKEQTLDEFNNARQVAYGNNVQVESLANDEADLSHEAWLDFKVKNKPQAERTVKWLIREYDIKLD